VFEDGVDLFTQVFQNHESHCAMLILSSVRAAMPCRAAAARHQRYTLPQ
jgi:hypothetical protein